MTNHQASLIDHQIQAREEHTRAGRNAPPSLHAKAIAKRVGVPVQEVEARLRARSAKPC